MTTVKRCQQQSRRNWDEMTDKVRGFDFKLLCLILTHSFIGSSCAASWVKVNKKVKCVGASYLHTRAPAAASCCLRGATFRLRFSLLLKEAEDKVPDAKHSFFINTRDAFRCVRKGSACVAPQRRRGPSALRTPSTGGAKLAAAYALLPLACYKIKVAASCGI